jgi:hypothetical protein
MEPDGSLPCSQEPTASPCPAPDESNPQPYTTLLLSFILLLSSDLHLRLVSGRLTSGFLTKMLYPFFIFQMCDKCPVRCIFQH